MQSSALCFGADSCDVERLHRLTVFPCHSGQWIDSSAPGMGMDYIRTMLLPRTR